MTDIDPALLKKIVPVATPLLGGIVAAITFVVGLRGDVTDLQHTVDRLEIRAEEVVETEDWWARDELSELRGDFDVIHSEQDSTRQRLDEIDYALDGIRAWLAMLQEPVDQYRDEIDNVFRELEDIVDYDDLDQMLDGLRDRINELQFEIDRLWQR
jgi:uncharacterized coiled-coil DUF342 family protein